MEQTEKEIKDRMQKLLEAIDTELTMRLYDKLHIISQSVANLAGALYTIKEAEAMSKGEEWKRGE